MSLGERRLHLPQSSSDTWQWQEPSPGPLLCSQCPNPWCCSSWCKSAHATSAGCSFWLLTEDAFMSAQYPLCAHQGALILYFVRAASVCWLPPPRRWEWKQRASSPEPASNHGCCLLFTHQRPQLTPAIIYIIQGKEIAIALNSAWWNSSTKGSFPQMHLKRLSALLGCLKFWIYRMHFLWETVFFPARHMDWKHLRATKWGQFTWWLNTGCSCENQK